LVLQTLMIALRAREALAGSWRSASPVGSSSQILEKVGMSLSRMPVTGLSLPLFLWRREHVRGLACVGLVNNVRQFGLYERRKR
jgi:hypothetical protein